MHLYTLIWIGKHSQRCTLDLRERLVKGPKLSHIFDRWCGFCCWSEFGFRFCVLPTKSIWQKGSILLYEGGVGFSIPWVSPGGARWRVQHLWRQWYGASELHGSWDSGSVWTVFFWGKHGRGYIDFNYAMYVYIFFNSYTYMPFFVHLYLIIYMIWLLRKEILCQLEWCIFFHVQGFIHSQDDACFRLDQQ